MEYVRETLALVQENLSQILSMANLTITWVDVVEILIISFLVYHVLIWIKSTRAWNLFKGIMVILIFVLLAAFFQMSTILWLAENTLGVGVIALVIIFQPELRTALENIGGKNILGGLIVFNKTVEEKFSNHTIDELIKAVFAMGKVKTGALIVIEDEIVLDATGRKNGRGAYICASMECLKNAIKRKGLERSLKVAIPTEVYDSLEQEMSKIAK